MPPQRLRRPRPVREQGNGRWPAGPPSASRRRSPGERRGCLRSPRPGVSCWPLAVRHRDLRCCDQGATVSPPIATDRQVRLEFRFFIHGPFLFTAVRRSRRHDRRRVRALGLLRPGRTDDTMRFSRSAPPAGLRLLQQRFEFLHDLRLIKIQVRGLSRVLLQVIKLPRRVGAVSCSA